MEKKRKSWFFGKIETKQGKHFHSFLFWLQQSVPGKSEGGPNMDY